MTAQNLVLLLFSILCCFTFINLPAERTLTGIELLIVVNICLMFATNSLISEVAVIIFLDSISSFAADGTVE